ncbi:MAG: divergent polysaccharide deacetylase family protein [Synergistaceae bacterium]|nr:divergent polysaccharide deacetylase family protein [Synergistaceae bacterium]
MGRHYRSPRTSFAILAKMALLLFLAAALVLVLCRLYPEHIPAPIVRTADEVVRKTEKITAEIRGINKIKGGTETTSRDKVPAPAIRTGAPESVQTDKRPVLSLVVDDGGEQMKLTRKISKLSIPLTWAIMPYTKYAQATAKLAASEGIPYLLHLPMQAEADKNGGPYLIGRGMSSTKIREITAAALDTLPDTAGLSNHRGSLATADRNTMEPVIDELKARQLIFLDSRTSGKSVAYDVAKAAGVTALKNNGFLDGTADKNAIKAKFNEAVKYAVKRGHLIVICHFRPVTVLFLEELNANYRTLPVRLITIPEMAGILALHQEKGDAE